MSFEALSQLFSSFSLSLGIKIFLLTFIFFYNILAVVIWRQTQLMSQILDEQNFSPFLKFLAAIHFFVALAVFILAIIAVIL